MNEDRLAPRTNEPLLRVKRVAIFGLFGLYDHDVPLHMDDRVTILHGPNGVGKTALLRLIAAVFDGRYTAITKVPFKKLDIELSDGSVITFEQTEKLNKHKHGYLALNLSLTVGGKTLHTNEISPRSPDAPEAPDTAATLAAVLSELSLSRQHRQERSWIDVLRSPAHGNPLYDRIEPIWHTQRARMEPEWFTELRSRVQVHLIETQRLLQMNPITSGRDGAESSRIVPTVSDYARDLHIRITDTLARYATQSQSLDQSFPQRLVKAAAQPGLEIPELKIRMSALNTKRTELQQIGLLDSTTMSPFDVASLDALEPAQSNVMSLYVEDTQKKLAVFDDLSERITILLGNVNGKFRNKSIRVHRDEGFVVVGPDGAPREPDALSSGEQHELVLLYDLLFRVSPGTLVLIDEPELSLHVSWQKRFLPDLLEIVQTAQFDALIATHSPFIVGDRSDLMVPLAADIDA
jgi:ABC-type nitrate/sulfonate/bicarbonate transport system ATPase subunit